MTLLRDREVPARILRRGATGASSARCAGGGSCSRPRGGGVSGWRPATGGSRCAGVDRHRRHRELRQDDHQGDHRRGAGDEDVRQQDARQRQGLAVPRAGHRAHQAVGRLLPRRDDGLQRRRAGVRRHPAPDPPGHRRGHRDRDGPPEHLRLRGGRRRPEGPADRVPPSARDRGPERRRSARPRHGAAHPRARHHLRRGRGRDPEGAGRGRPLA